MFLNERVFLMSVGFGVCKEKKKKEEEARKTKWGWKSRENGHM